MIRERRRTILAATIVIAGIALVSAQGPPQPGSQPQLPLVDPYVARPRVLVMTDIANEPDDQMSLVRFKTTARPA